MPDVIKRLKYFNGQFLRQPDFTDEQDYHLDRQRRHNRQLHTPGIADGLAVTADPDATSVSVAPGTAIDGQGRQIVLNATRLVGFPSSLNGHSALVVISYAEEESDPSSVGDAGPTRWKEVPRVEAILDPGTQLGSDEIALVRLEISSGGTITRSDMNVRTPAGARLHPEATIERLRLLRQGVPDSQWPVLSSGAADRADLAGSLNVNGNILVTGTVDGRDIAADGALNDAHRARTDNPHNVTAAQVGAIASIDGVSSPGGNVDLAGANGIVVTGNNSTKVITIAGGSPISIAGVSNAGGNIAINGSGGVAVAGDDNANSITITGSAPSTIDGVSNPGGNIDFVGSGGISISPDNGVNKQITISTSPADIGALPVNEYLRRTTAYVSYDEDSTSGSHITISVGFTPKMIWVSGRTYAQVVNNDDSYFGGVTHGYCKVNSPGSFSQQGHGPTIRRFSQLFGTGWSIRNHFISGIAKFDFDDRTVTPRARIQFEVTVSDVTSSEIVLELYKSFGGYSAPYFAFMQLYFTILG